MELAPSEKVEILGSQISVWDVVETSDKINELVRERGRHYICVSNVHTVVMGAEDPAFANVTNQATLATADGVPLIWASYFVRGPKVHGRASGPDILHYMLSEPRFSHLRHYFYGSTPAVLSSLEKRLRSEYPAAKFAGFYSPPMRPAKSADVPLDQSEMADCANIDAVQADVVWVGLGAPKQEIWMARARPHLKAPVLIGVGAAFDFLSGNKKRSPLWMQKLGLEWLHRWSQEPKRLASRYLHTNPRFVVGVFGQALRGLLKKT